MQIVEQNNNQNEKYCIIHALFADGFSLHCITGPMNIELEIDDFSDLPDFQGFLDNIKFLVTHININFIILFKYLNSNDIASFNTLEDFNDTNEYPQENIPQLFLKSIGVEV